MQKDVRYVQQKTDTCRGLNEEAYTLKNKQICRRRERKWDWERYLDANADLYDWLSTWDSIFIPHEFLMNALHTQRHTQVTSVLPFRHAHQPP